MNVEYAHATEATKPLQRICGLKRDNIFKCQYQENGTLEIPGVLGNAFWTVLKHANTLQAHSKNSKYSYCMCTLEAAVGTSPTAAMYVLPIVLIFSISL